MEITQEIISYINCKEHNGALLLTGKWGCGKTFLVRRISEELNKGEKYALVTISLFGIASIEELHKKIKEKVFYATIDPTTTNEEQQKVSKFRTVATSVSSVLKDYSNILKGVNAALSINLYDFIDVKRKITCHRNGKLVDRDLAIIFDDFERSNIDKVDLLGAINDYSENKRIKTIIVADENHIKGKEYSEFKEKLISRTVKLSSNYVSIIRTICGNYNETEQGYRNFLIENIELIIRVFLESQSENLRTFKSYIVDFERVYGAWRKNELPDDNMKDVLYAFGTILFEYKANNYEKSPEYGYAFSESEAGKKYSMLKSMYQLNSLQRWIVEGEWEEQALIEEIRKLIPEELTNEQKFLIYNFWDLEQEYISGGLPLVVERAYSGDLAGNELISLIQKIYLLKKYNVELPCEVDYSHISEGLNKRELSIMKGELIEPPCHTFIPPEIVNELDLDAQTLYQRIEKLNDKAIGWKNRLDFINCIRSGEDIPQYGFKGSFLVSFDDELLTLFFKQFQKKHNSMKRQLVILLKNTRFDFTDASDKENISETVKNLKKLETMIEKLQDDETDGITKAIISETVGVIHQMSQQLQIKIQ